MELLPTITVRPQAGRPRVVPDGPTGPEDSPGRQALGRVRVDGKFFDAGGHRWPLKGLTYGPFSPRGRGDDGSFLPAWPRLRDDFRHIRKLGANAIRVYHVPPRQLLDEAAAAGLRVLVDVPWEKHRCFFEDWDSQQDAVRRVRAAAAELGDHPALFAISVANEFPSDIVRFYGRRRVERFVDALLDTVKQAQPDCLATFANYPPTEFLCPAHPGPDFVCFNVYLNDPDALAAYLDRLQHLAGPKPLILGEFGLDSFRHGEPAQAEALSTHVRQVFRQGLAGSFVFSYTDDWYTGGHQVEDWAFGVTDRTRQEKPAADALRLTWEQVESGRQDALPKASVVVCSYNGAATLDECLRSLTALNYPDYEVLLIDDGSTDDTPAIAARFPGITYVRQDNQGLSAARNVGARAASGEIVVYTDSDCVADPDWLLHLVRAMRDQGMDAVGGPNIPPASDSWTAKCVAASPGGPSHVMLDDRRAEHVPGCNMAFDRRKLLDLGGFDPQFRQAGDDVDICWRFMDAGLTIGFAPAAVVWHHRRNTVRAYLRQQQGYGRSEAMLQFKHPHRFNGLGCSRWAGVIYGEGAVGLPVAAPVIYHGPFGTGLFQTIYQHNRYSAWAYFTLLEWHGIAAGAALLGVLLPPLLVVSALMGLASLVAALRSSLGAPLPPAAPWWCRPVVFGLHLAQPVVRAWHRYRHRLGRARQVLPDAATSRAGQPIRDYVKHVARGRRDLYWSSHDGRGREDLLDALTARARAAGWPGEFGNGWAAWDVRLVGDVWHDTVVRTATEQLGGPERFTRARFLLRPTGAAKVAAAAAALLTVAAAVSGAPVGLGLAAAAGLALACVLLNSRRRCFGSIARLLSDSGRDAGLVPVRVTPAAPPRRPEAVRLAEDFEEVEARVA